ncbi:MAG: hypothetical protein AB1468_03085 [Candidatus Micrarchaeota archaeon]
MSSQRFNPSRSIQYVSARGETKFKLISSRISEFTLQELGYARMKAEKEAGIKFGIRVFTVDQLFLCANFLPITRASFSFRFGKISPDETLYTTIHTKGKVEYVANTRNLSAIAAFSKKSKFTTHIHLPDIKNLDADKAAAFQRHMKRLLFSRAFVLHFNLDRVISFHLPVSQRHEPVAFATDFLLLVDAAMRQGILKGVKVAVEPYAGPAADLPEFREPHVWMKMFTRRQGEPLNPNIGMIIDPTHIAIYGDYKASDFIKLVNENNIPIMGFHLHGSEGRDDAHVFPVPWNVEDFGELITLINDARDAGKARPVTVELSRDIFLGMNIETLAENMNELMRRVYPDKLLKRHHRLLRDELIRLSAKAREEYSQSA